MHARPSINRINMISAEDPCIQEMMQIRRDEGAFRIISKQHDVATRCPWVNNVSSTLNIISGEVESNKLVVVYAVILEKHEIACISIGATKRSSIQARSDAGRL